MSKNTKYKVLSLFSGCGGLDLGFQGGFSYLGNRYRKNLFEIVWANDIDAYACLTYERYFKHPIACGDIRDILQSKHNEIPSHIDVVLGGFPCQDFSHAGKRRGFSSERGTLYQAMVEVIKRTTPKLFLAENVKGLLTINKGEAISQIISDFSKLGYHVSYKLLSVADFGVPQARERVIIIGTKKSLLPPYDFSVLDTYVKPRIPLKDAIGELEAKGEGELDNHFWSKAKRNKGQGNTTVNMNTLAPTMRAEHHGNIEFHWNNTRRLSAREAARIQSFPDDFIFYPSTSSAYKQIGNAVPPVFAWCIANSIASFMSSNLKLKEVE